jgi:uncharacterized phage protein gp47/JayE
MSITPVSIGTVSDVIPGSLVVPPIDYTSRDYASLVNDMLNLIPSYLPEWTDRSPGDFGVVLIELFAYMGDILNYYSDRIANEAFIGTAQQRQSVLNLASLLDYTPYNSVAATTSPLTNPPGGLQFTIATPSPTPVLIPQGTQVSTTMGLATQVSAQLPPNQGVIFETTQSLWIYGDGIVNTVPLPNNPAITSTGQPNQQFVLVNPNVGYPTYIFNGGNANQIVTVAGVQWTLAPGNSFSGVSPTATNFIVVNGNTVQFGNGVNGAIPANGANILIYYSTTALTPATPVTAAPTVASQYIGSVAAMQGVSTLGEGLGISTGNPSQKYGLFGTPVVDGSVTVYVDEGGGPTPWTYYQRIVDAMSSSQAFTLSTDANGVVTVIFGDGVAGQIPSPGAFISADYMVGGGVMGNVAANTLTQLQSAVQGVVSVTNPLGAAGGADAETTDHIRIHAPLSITAINRAVSLDDYAALTLNVPGIAKASAMSTAYNAVNVYVHPAGNFFSNVSTLVNQVNVLAQFLTNSAMTGYLDDKRMVQVSVVVLPPQYNKSGLLSSGYVPVNITVTVQVLPQYNNGTVQQACVAAIQSLFLFSLVDFGSYISLSSVYHALMNVPGVDYVNVNVLARNEASPQGAADVVCQAYEIPQANQIIVNANGGILT